MRRTTAEPELMDDRREALRKDLTQLSILVTHPGLGAHTATLTDVSRTGVRFECEFCFPCGDTVIASPPSATGLPLIKARIVRLKLMELGDSQRFEYGAKFTEDAEIRRHTWWLTLRRAA